MVTEQERNVPYSCPECAYQHVSYIKALGHYYWRHKGQRIVTTIKPREA